MNPRTWSDRPDLGDREVLVFRGRAGPATTPGEGPTEWLSDPERGRAERFRRDKDRQRYVFRTLFRRRVLGHLLGFDPGRVSFLSGPHDKPLLDPIHGSDIHFSASHSEGEVLLAVARREVGIDIQDLRPLADLDAMAARILHSVEEADWIPLPPAERIRAFYRLWCRKEAALKALGEGFHRDPVTLRIGFAPAPAGTPWVPRDPALSTFGSLTDLTAPDGFAAALCARGADWRVVEIDGA